ncbi:MAG: Na+/H+ antiporter NhaC family protein [Candidatus Marinimicrobia bacterium]|jgi:NhaC family Na+:H+ antiporter|nr:Na+/H+ antiporter NhaC family protein [Candidatus Neomarinimicrobiota bacterium]
MAKITRLSFIKTILPVLFLGGLILYGMVLRPQLFEQPIFPLEVIFMLAAVFAIGELMILGFAWGDIQDAIIKKLARGFPAILILFSIGVIIGTWMVSGTIPMLIYYGIRLINPAYIYLLAFLIPIIFSTLTGTSWGSIGTIGVVIIGIAAVIGANLGITAGAIVGGAFFGDKLSPLSDTTNLAAMATDVNLYDHIRSMMVTTLPSAIIAGTIYFILGFVYPPTGSEIDTQQVAPTLNAIASMFNFNGWLLIPPIIVLIGSIRKMATLPTLLTSSMSAALLALIFQPYSSTDIMAAIHKGFDTNMAFWVNNAPTSIHTLFTRGGLYELNEAIIFSIMVFVFIGTIDLIDAMPTIVDRVFGFIKSRSSLIVSSLFATAFTNGITSNQSATSFIIGDAFGKRYDQSGVNRKVLSRSIEDYGTMFESLVPWHATAIFLTTTLGVAYGDYWHWQLLSLINLVMAPALAIMGKGCFYEEDET